jgi:hypothetical protein
MKSKVLVVLALIVGLTIGFFVGRFQGGQAVSSFVESSIINAGAAVDAQQAVRALTWLKEGKTTNGFDVLELRLDHSLLTLSHAKELTPDMRDAIRIAREYRTKYPWNGTTPELKSQIEQVLSVAK